MIESSDLMDFDDEIDIMQQSGDIEGVAALKAERAIRKEQELSYININILQLLYFILGAAIRSALGAIKTQMKKQKLENDLIKAVFNCLTNCTLESFESAEYQHLPYQLILDRQKKKEALLCPSCPIFTVFVELESKVLEPLFTNTSALAALSTDFITYINLRIDCEGFYARVDDILYDALKNLSDLSLKESDKVKIVETVREKLFKYYINTATKDLIKFIMRTLNNDKAISRLSFRARTLLESIKNDTSD